MGASNFELVFISSTWDCTTFHNFLPMFKKKIQKLAGLWLAGEVVNHVGIYGSKAAEGLSAFQRRSCLYWTLFWNLVNAVDIHLLLKTPRCHEVDKYLRRNKWLVLVAVWAHESYGWSQCWLKPAPLGKFDIAQILRVPATNRQSARGLCPAGSVRPQWVNTVKPGEVMVNGGSGNYLLPDNFKPLHDPWLSCHHEVLLHTPYSIIRKMSKISIRKYVWKLHI